MTATTQTRIQLELSSARVAELESLMEQTGIATKKELMNQALTLFEWAVKERRAGRLIASVDEASQKYKEILMPALEHAERTPIAGSGQAADAKAATPARRS